MFAELLRAAAGVGGGDSCEHGRRALAEVSSAVFGASGKGAEDLSAVTGTNGKTTTAFSAGSRCCEAWGGSACCSGRSRRMYGRCVVRPSEHTTPESRDVLALFAEAVCALAAPRR